MGTITLFVECAQQHGYSEEAAHAAFAAISARLAHQGYPPQSRAFYVYRTAGRGGDDIIGGIDEPGTRPPRQLVAFASPDAALAFAQHNRLRPTPRLVPMSLAHLLTALLCHSTIQALIFSDEQASPAPETRIPTLFRLSRTELLDILKGNEL